MVTEEGILSSAQEFIRTYLRSIRHSSSMFSRRDWGFFPRYWFHPVKISIFHTFTDDLAINFGDLAKAREDRIRTIEWGDRVETSQFPHLDYRKWPFFSVPNKTHHSLIQGGTYNVGDHPLIVLGDGVEFRLMNIRVEANTKGYPREREFLWFFTNPCRAYLVDQGRASEEAEYDFWNRLGYIVFTKLDQFLARDLSSKVISIFLDSVDRLQKEYHSLITREDIEEQRLQNFLENHFFLIDPKESFTKEKRKLGEYYADFVLKYTNGNSTLVEIQLNNDPIVQKGGLSKGFREAVEQLQNWFKWIRLNQPEALPTYSGLVIIGREVSYRENQMVIQRILSKFSPPIRLITYDDLERSFDWIRGKLQDRTHVGK